jgi:hypothetical protein
MFDQVHITHSFYKVFFLLLIFINTLFSQVWDVRKTISPVREFVGHSKGFISLLILFVSHLLLANVVKLHVPIIILMYSLLSRCNCYVVVPL